MMRSLNKRKVRGQASLEFLMTYGWAILVVLVVISSLAYFGVLNPQQFLPRKCQFGQGFICIDHQLLKTGGTFPGKLTILLNNGLGNDVEITKFNFTSDNNKVTCAKSSIGLIITAGSEKALSVNCTKLDLPKGVRVKGTMRLSYDDLLSNLDHTIPGTLLTDIE